MMCVPGLELQSIKKEINLHIDDPLKVRRRKGGNVWVDVEGPYAK